MNEYLSLKLKVLSSISIVMVLYIHMFYTEGIGMKTLSFIEDIIGDGICRIAVPLFYVISGYLFFLKMPDGVKSIFGKLKKRIHTLFIPYILTNVLTFIFFVVVNVFTILVPKIDVVVNTHIFDTIKDGFWPTFKLIFLTPPIAFQLWFLRDLMMVMLFSPFIYLLIKWISSFKFGALFCFIVLSMLFILIGDSLTLSAFVWFSMGAVLSISNFNLKKTVKNKSVYILFLIYLGWSIYGAYYNLSNSIMRFIPFIGIPSIWFIYDMAFGSWAESTYIQEFCQYPFFIYLIHEPTLNIFKKIPLLISSNQIMLIVCYLTIPILFYITGSIVGHLCKQHISHAYNVFVGGR